MFTFMYLLLVAFCTGRGKHGDVQSSDEMATPGVQVVFETIQEPKVTGIN
jgi:hypothetical protein